MTFVIYMSYGWYIPGIYHSIFLRFIPGIYLVYTFQLKLCSPPGSRIAIEMQQHTGIGLQGCLMSSATRQPPAGARAGPGSRHWPGSRWTQDRGAAAAAVAGGGSGGEVAPPPLPAAEEADAAPPSLGAAPRSLGGLGFLSIGKWYIPGIYQV